MDVKIKGNHYSLVDLREKLETPQTEFTTFGGRKICLGKENEKFRYNEILDALLIATEKSMDANEPLPFIAEDVNTTKFMEKLVDLKEVGHENTGVLYNLFRRFFPNFHRDAKLNKLKTLFATSEKNKEILLGRAREEDKTRNIEAADRMVDLRRKEREGYRAFLESPEVSFPWDKIQSEKKENRVNQFGDTIRGINETLLDDMLCTQRFTKDKQESIVKGLKAIIKIVKKASKGRTNNVFDRDMAGNYVKQLKKDGATTLSEMAILCAMVSKEKNNDSKIQIFAKCIKLYPLSDYAEILLKANVIPKEHWKGLAIELGINELKEALSQRKTAANQISVPNLYALYAIHEQMTLKEQTECFGALEMTKNGDQIEIQYDMQQLVATPAAPLDNTIKFFND